MSHFGDMIHHTNIRGQHFLVQLNLQIPDGCDQNATYESVRQQLLANFTIYRICKYIFTTLGCNFGIWRQIGVYFGPKTGKWSPKYWQMVA